jgi:hypothetical protein
MTDAAWSDIIKRRAFGVCVCMCVAWVGFGLWRGSPEPAPFKKLTLDPTMMTRAEWTLVPGIGPALATRLHEAKVSGAFACEDRRQAMLDVHGIGERLLSRLERHVELDGPE